MSRMVTMNDGVRLHVREEGSGRRVFLLHGFPETSASWEKVTPLLTSRGFRVIAPDLRGYGKSDRPYEIQSYAIDRLVEDVVMLIKEQNEKTVLVGHDWGGLIAWHVAMQHPELLSHLVILNAPHPAWTTRFGRLRRQWLRSWYVFFFQILWFPELLGRVAGKFLLRRLLTTEAPGAFSEEQLHEYAELATQSRPWINYYRAWMWSRPWKKKYPVIETPTLVLWGDCDRHLGKEISDPDPSWVQHFVVKHTNASHWLQNEKSTWVADEIMLFVRES